MKPIIWLTGQPGSGKTTLANALSTIYINSTIIDGDDLRTIFGNANYSKEGRYENIRTAQKIARFLQSKDHQVIVSLVAPYKELREELKSTTKVCEVYLQYNGDRGKNKFLSTEYEPPTENFLHLDTSIKTIEECVDEICSFCR